MHKGFMAAGAIFGGLAVALGAFGAHGLEQLTTDARIRHGFETGASYQLYHAFALLITALVYDRAPNQFIKWAGYFFYFRDTSFFRVTLPAYIPENL